MHKVLREHKDKEEIKVHTVRKVPRVLRVLKEIWDRLVAKET